MIGIYKITNNITGKVYIGQSGAVEHRWGNHKRTATSPNYKQYNKDVPVYSKRKKQWFLDNKPYRLEP